MSLAEETEGKIRKYFKKKQWNVEKLDLKNKKAADFRISNNNYSFLCEVKTIESDRAFNSNTYSNSFRKYKKDILNLKDNPNFKNLPFRIRIDCDDLYLPNRTEISDFIIWLQRELANIHQGRVPRTWRKNQFGFDINYTFRNHTKKEKGRLQIIAIVLPAGTKFSIDFFSYGDINLRAIERNVEEGVTQLNVSASREINTKIPRVIVLRFASGIGFQLKELENEIQEIFRENPTLSAIAVFNLVFKVSKKSWDFWEIIINALLSPKQIVFYVYHNKEIHGAERLHRYVFDDGLSGQINI
ncbi:MAG: hypothetical protein PVF83_13250 [Anaerolineales bacterium]|jgi:hypothetical protein